jgi:hypothetical protein
MLGTVRRWTLRFAAAGALSAGAGAYWYRPFPDHSNDNGGPTREGCASVKNLYEVSHYRMCCCIYEVGTDVRFQNGDENDPLTLTLARYIVVPVTGAYVHKRACAWIICSACCFASALTGETSAVSLSRVYLRYFNDFSIREDENYRNLLKQVFSRYI